jgi:hypothetical protein
MSIQLAPKLPLSYSEGVGPYTPITDYLSLVKQNMKMVLLTSPGERVMIPEYGVGLKRFLFLQNTETTLDNMRERIRYSRTQGYFWSRTRKFFAG